MVKAHHSLLPGKFFSLAPSLSRVMNGSGGQ